MASKKKVVADVGVQVTGIVLRTLRFERLDHDGVEDTDATLDTSFGIGVGRPGADLLNVELTVSFEKPGAARVEMAYVAQFKRTRDLPRGKSDEEFWQTVASQVGPVVLYPFIRETATSLTTKAGLGPLLLPIVNFKALFEPKEIAIPPLAES